MRAVIPLLAAGLLVTLSACAGADETPVPLEADRSEVLCAGMPTAGAVLMTNASELVGEVAAGSWEEGNYLCTALFPNGEPGVFLERKPVTGDGFAGEEEALAAGEQREAARAVESDGTLFGYAYSAAEGQAAEAALACSGSLTLVTLFVRPSGRDGIEDVARYAQSLLPWACGSEAAPTG